MTRAEVLNEVLELEGVTSAAFVGAGGEVLESLARGGCELATLQDALTGYFASSRVLAELLGASAATQTVLGFEGGAALLTTLATDAPVSVVTLSSADELGRVRFCLRRLLPQLSESGEVPRDLRK